MSISGSDSYRGAPSQSLENSEVRLTHEDLSPTPDIVFPSPPSFPPHFDPPERIESLKWSLLRPVFIIPFQAEFQRWVCVGLSLPPRTELLESHPQSDEGILMTMEFLLVPERIAETATTPQLGDRAMTCSDVEIKSAKLFTPFQFTEKPEVIDDRLILKNQTHQFVYDLKEVEKGRWTSEPRVPAS